MIKRILWQVIAVALVFNICGSANAEEKGGVLESVLSSAKPLLSWFSSNDLQPTKPLVLNDVYESFYGQWSYEQQRWGGPTDENAFIDDLSKSLIVANDGLVSSEKLYLQWIETKVSSGRYSEPSKKLLRDLVNAIYDKSDLKLIAWFVINQNWMNDVKLSQMIQKFGKMADKTTIPGSPFGTSIGDTKIGDGKIPEGFSGPSGGNTAASYSLAAGETKSFEQCVAENAKKMKGAGTDTFGDAGQGFMPSGEGNLPRKSEKGMARSGGFDEKQGTLPTDACTKLKPRPSAGNPKEEGNSDAPKASSGGKPTDSLGSTPDKPADGVHAADVVDQAADGLSPDSPYVHEAYNSLSPTGTDLKIKITYKTDSGKKYTIEEDAVRIDSMNNVNHVVEPDDEKSSSDKIVPKDCMKGDYWDAGKANAWGEKKVGEIVKNGNKSDPFADYSNENGCNVTDLASCFNFKTPGEDAGNGELCKQVTVFSLNNSLGEINVDSVDPCGDKSKLGPEGLKPFTKQQITDPSPRGMKR